MVAQEHRPLAVFGNRWRLFEDVDDRKSILHLQRHEHPRHEREMEVHVRLVALPEIFDRVFRPLVRLGEKHASGEFRLHVRAQFLQVFVRFGEIFAVRAFAFVEVGNRVEPQTVHAHAQPKIEHLLHGLVHCRIVEIQIRLVRIKPVPVIGLRHRIPRPVRSLEILEDDSRVLVFLWRITPDIEVRKSVIVRFVAEGVDPGALLALPSRR